MVVVVVGEGGGGVVAVERVWGWEGGGERRYATLPQAPPLPDWKVMGLKETSSRLSPHLRLSGALDFFFSSSSSLSLFFFPWRSRAPRARAHSPANHTPD